MLSNPSKQITIYCPMYCGRAQLLQELQDYGWQSVSEIPLITTFYLLTRHPVERMLEAYLRDLRIRATDKELRPWIFSNTIPPMVPCGVIYKDIIRLEEYRLDVANHLGIALPDREPTPLLQESVPVCSAGKTEIRRKYANDYKLGNYE